MKPVVNGTHLALVYIPSLQCCKPKPFKSIAAATLTRIVQTLFSEQEDAPLTPVICHHQMHQCGNLSEMTDIIGHLVEQLLFTAMGKLVSYSRRYGFKSGQGNIESETNSFCCLCQCILSVCLAVCPSVCHNAFNQQLSGIHSNIHLLS
jgi:hypothetical protein